MEHKNRGTKILNITRKIVIVILSLLISSNGVLGIGTGTHEPGIGPKDAGLMVASKAMAQEMIDADIPNDGPPRPLSSDKYVLVANSTESDATGRNYQRKLVREDGGTLFTVFEDNGEIWISNSTDDGQTWSTPLNMSNTLGTSFAPAIATNGTAIYIAWLESYDVLFRYSTDSGATWTPALDQAPTTIHSSGGWSTEARMVSLATDGTDTVYVLYTRGDWSDEVVTLRRSTNGGQAWQAAQSLTNDWYDREDPSIVAQGQYVHIVYMEYTWGGDDWDIYYMASDNRGLDFSFRSTTDISRNSAHSQHPCIAINGTGGVAVVWEDEQDGDEDVRYRYSSDHGGSWDPDLSGSGLDLSDNMVDSVHPSLVAIDEEVWVLWRDMEIHATGDLFYKHYNGTNWSAPVAFTYSTLGHAFPNLNHDPPTSKVEWVWTGKTSAPYDIYYDYLGVGGSPPVLNWSGTAGYQSEGVAPDNGTTGHIYTFRVNYTDDDDDAPEADFPEVWMDRDRDGFYDSENERTTMLEADPSDTTYSDGKEYYYSTEFPEVGLYNYTFRARDEKHSPAVGEPTSRHPGPNVTSVNVRPELWWTEESDGYADDGLDPEQGSTATVFEFRIKYMDGLNEAPEDGFPELLIDMDDDGDFEGLQDFMATMEEVSVNDTTYFNGKIYTYSRMFDPGDHRYKFRVKDLVGLVNETEERGGPNVTITGAQPVLSTTLEPGYIDDCVHPDEGFDTTEFTFRVNYTDGDNDPPVPGSVKVGIDLDLDGNITDAERFQMEEAVPQDTTYSDDKVYTFTKVLNTLGLYNHEFTATDASLAKADPFTLVGPNVTGINSPPRLGWTQELGYSMDGLEPENGTVEETVFVYRVKYTDADNDPPEDGYPKIGIDMDRNGTFEVEEYFAMEAITPTDNLFSDGKLYVYVTTFLEPGDYSYIFEAKDAKSVPATGVPTGRHFGPTVVPDANLPPLLSWVGTGNFADRGLNPLEGGLNTTFVYKISYIDAEGDFPAEGYPVLSIDIDLDGTYEATESFTMSEEDSADTNLSDGKVYLFETTFSRPGDNYTYKFDARDGNRTFAVGLAGQVFEGPVVIRNLAPTLLQVGTVGYQIDFVEPDTGPEGTTFTFKVIYRDPEGDEPYNGTVWVWVDLNLDGDFDDNDERKAMAEAVPSDVDYSDGKVYLATQTLEARGTYGYRFYAMDSFWNEPYGPGTAAYIRGPVVEEEVVVPNRPPELVFLGEGDFVLDGVDPIDGDVGTEFEFRVRYIDLDNDTPTEGQPRILIDMNMDGDFDDPGDLNGSMLPLDSADLIVHDGKSYYYKFVLEAGGTYNYKFIVVNERGQAASLGPFEGPVLTEKLKTIKEPGPGWDLFLPWALLILIMAIIGGLALGFAFGRRRSEEPRPEMIEESPPREGIPDKEKAKKTKRVEVKNGYEGLEEEDLELEEEEGGVATTPSGHSEEAEVDGTEAHEPEPEESERTKEARTELKTKAGETEAPPEDADEMPREIEEGDIDKEIGTILSKLDND